MANQNTLYAGYPWRFRHFRKTNGYANMPLDGIWLRAPYLHNGSVPTLRDLLAPPEDRPDLFYRGYDVFDPEKVGFVSGLERIRELEGLSAEGVRRRYFLFDTAERGNRNGGHTYGTRLPSGEKAALVEYMKTF